MANGFPQFLFHDSRTFGLVLLTYGHWRMEILAEANMRDCQECIATIWCLCIKTNKLKKTKGEGHQAELNRPEKGTASGYAEDGMLG
jgi:hypothetical protein